MYETIKGFVLHNYLLKETVDFLKKLVPTYDKVSLCTVQMDQPTLEQILFNSQNKIANSMKALILTIEARYTLKPKSFQIEKN